MMDQNACANSILFYKAKPHKERYYCRMMSLWPLLFYNVLNIQLIRLRNKMKADICPDVHEWPLIEAQTVKRLIQMHVALASLSVSCQTDWTLDNEACLRDQPVTLEPNLISFKRPLHVVCERERAREGGKTAGECISILAVCGYGAVA